MEQKQYTEEQVVVILKEAAAVSLEKTMNALNFNTPTPEPLTWDTVLKLFDLRCKSKNISALTQELYASQMRIFKNWLTTNGNPKPTEVEATHLRAYLNAGKARGNSDATVDCAYRVMRTLWRFLRRDGLILQDPMEKVERPCRERRFIKPFTEKQLRLVLAQIDMKDKYGIRDYAFILLLADTGLRLGEALSLKVHEIDWANNSVIVLGKGRKERRVAFGQTAKSALIRWLRRRGVKGNPDWLFLTRRGQKMKRCGFGQRMKDYTVQAGIAAKRLSPHALRHFFALQFLKNGGDLMTLQKLLGHTSLEMVRNYVNMTDDDALAKHRQASPLDRMGPLTRIKSSLSP